MSVQWDLERSPALGMLPYRSIQIGIGREMSEFLSSFFLFFFLSALSFYLPLFLSVLIWGLILRFHYGVLLLITCPYGT